MSIVRVRTRSAAARAVRNEIRRRLESPALGQVLVAMATRRVENSRDSEISYPDLWASSVPGHYRSGGRPLWDTGSMIASLRGEFTRASQGGTWALAVSENQQHAIYHQRGFSTDGPNFIPITRRAALLHRKGRNPRNEGLTPGEDYIMAWKGVTVPARPIFNWPPEDRQDFEDALRRLISQE